MSAELLQLRQLVTSYGIGEFVSRKLVYDVDIARAARFNLDCHGNILIYNDILSKLNVPDLDAFRLFNFGNTPFRVLLHAIFLETPAVPLSKTNVSLVNSERVDSSTSPIHFGPDVSENLVEMNEVQGAGYISPPMLRKIKAERDWVAFDNEQVEDLDPVQNIIPEPQTIFEGPHMVGRHYRGLDALPIVYSPLYRKPYISKARVRIGNRGAFIESDVNDPSLINLLSLEPLDDRVAALNTASCPLITDELGRKFHLAPCPLPYTGMYSKGSLSRAPSNFHGDNLLQLTSRLIPQINRFKVQETGAQFLATKFVEIRDNWVQQPVNLREETTSLREFRKLRSDFLNLSNQRNGERGIQVVNNHPGPGERRDYWLVLNKAHDALEQDPIRVRRGLNSRYGLILADLHYIYGGKPEYCNVFHWQEVVYNRLCAGFDPVRYVRRLAKRFNLACALRPACAGFYGPPEDFSVYRPANFRAFSTGAVSLRSGIGSWPESLKLRRADSFEDLSMGGGRHMMSVREAGRVAAHYFGEPYLEHNSSLHLAETLPLKGDGGIPRVKLNVQTAVDTYYRVWYYRISSIPLPTEDSAVVSSPLTFLPNLMPLQTLQVQDWQDTIIGAIAEKMKIPFQDLKEEAENILSDWVNGPTYVEPLRLNSHPGLQTLSYTSDPNFLTSVFNLTRTLPDRILRDIVISPDPSMIVPQPFSLPVSPVLVIDEDTRESVISVDSSVDLGLPVKRARRSSHFEMDWTITQAELDERALLHSDEEMPGEDIPSDLEESVLLSSSEVIKEKLE